MHNRLTQSERDLVVKVIGTVAAVCISSQLENASKTSQERCDATQKDVVECVNGLIDERAGNDVLRFVLERMQSPSGIKVASA